MYAQCMWMDTTEKEEQS
ncbi:Uncharacterized protein APZ42_021984 [Daphnia magna]|uniref:Uncharacterized protein n=1 Tax=Daphnia magna TaxID=35525 RepID=A0A164W6H2_9CRUS|nr:Uncharacterized protein APZ42_021984 [Daphnia magna]